MSATEGPFRIAVVAELTGVAEATLRAWERRYGIPSPDRAASGYRLYSMTQVEQALEMRRLCESGMAAADAAARILRRSKERDGSGAVSFADDSFDILLGNIFEAIETFDDALFEQSLRKAMFVGSPVQIFDGVLAPLLVAVGDAWHAGTLTVAQEHWTTRKVTSLVTDLLRLTTPASGPQVVLASFAEEPHEIGVLGFGLRLASWGSRPLVLGARTPPAAVRSVVESIDPALVALSVTTPPSPARARELCDEYASACEKTPWLVGGLAAPAIADLVKASGGLVAPRNPAELEGMIRALPSKPAQARNRNRKTP